MNESRFESPRDPFGAVVDQPAAGARVRALLMLISAAVVGAAALVGIERWQPKLQDWIASDPAGGADRLTMVLVVLAATADLPLVFGAAYFWRLGTQTIAARRFPPAGAMVLRTTPVLTGDAAIRRGRAARLCAVGLLACSMALVAILVGLALLASTGGRS